MRPQIPVRLMLTCPDCATKSPFPVAALVPGRTVACPRCGSELDVSHDRDTPDGPPIWRLEIPDLAEDQARGT